MTNTSLTQAEIVVLGCGTSTGVPVPGCTCAVCTSTNPRNARLRTSAFIRFPDQRGLLIDASPDLRSQVLTHRVSQVDAVFYTHIHADHILGTDDLRVFNFGRPEPIPCYGEEVTLRDLRKFFDYIFSPNPNYQGGALAKLTCHPVQAGERFPFGPYSILPIELFHGSMPVLGLRIGDFAYATDCNRIPEASRAALQGVRVLFLDALRYEPHPTHFTIAEAISLSDQLKIEKTYLIHMTHNVDYEMVSRELPAHVALAYDGLRVNFNPQFL